MTCKQRKVVGMVRRFEIASAYSRHVHGAGRAGVVAYQRRRAEGG